MVVRQNYYIYYSKLKIKNKKNFDKKSILLFQNQYIEFTMSI